MVVWVNHHFILSLQTMKWFPFILAVYFLGLALITCTDGDVLPELSDSGHVVLMDDDHAGHDHQTSDFDGCSPLCTCHCCHIHVTVGEATDITTIIDYLISSPSYLDNFKESHHFDFFVPPRA